MDDSLANNNDDTNLLKDLIRNHNRNLTARQQQNRSKAAEYNTAQLSVLNNIHIAREIPLHNNGEPDKHEDLSSNIVRIPSAPWFEISYHECVALKKKIFSTAEYHGSDDEASDMARNLLPNDINDDQMHPDHRKTIILENDDDIELSDAQKNVVADLKAAVEKGQLLWFLQGFPGSGKTTTAKKLAQVTGLRVLFCGTTGTASAIFKSKTVNSLLCLGLSVDKVDLATETTSAQMASNIVHIMENYDLLLIDEASMLTPVTLARIDLRLRQCFDPDLPFGGRYILLCGDMWQFPPVSGLWKPALYQAAVAVATNKKVPNEAYRAGANLFTQFKLFVLNDQQRMKKDYADHLAPLRDTSLKYPITKD